MNDHILQQFLIGAISEDHFVRCILKEQLEIISDRWIQADEKGEHRIANDFRNEWRQIREKLCARSGEELHLTHRHFYQVYLNSFTWRSLRMKKLRKNPYCEQCGSKNFLEVHHRRYPKNWGEEEFSDLLTLCRRCHGIKHGRERG